MNDNALGKIFAAGVVGGLLFLLVQIYRNIKYSKSEEGKLHKKLDKKKTALSQISKYESTDGFVNKDLIEAKKKELAKEIEDDIILYQLKTNKEYIELQNLKKQGILDIASFNQAVEKIKDNLKEKPNDKIRFIELENGERLKVEQYFKGTLKNAKLLSHLDQYENNLVKSGDLILEISNNKIKNIFKEREYENGFLIAQQKSTISNGDRILKPVKEFQYDLIKVLPFCAIRINKNVVLQVYWIKKGKTLNKKNIEIYQKDRDKRSFGDLVFIDSNEAKNGFHFLTIYGSFSILKTKSGKII